MINGINSKVAVLSMDVEDWYHLDYLTPYTSQADIDYSMLDGLDVFCEIISDNNIPGSFFVLSDMVTKFRDRWEFLVKSGCDCGVHGLDHCRPLLKTPSIYEMELKQAKEQIEQTLGVSIDGYRAPCFAIDDERLDIVRRCQFKYDASRMDFGSHPLYGTLSMKGFKQISPGVYKDQEFIEFENSSISALGKRIPISGGGYLRMFPWLFMKRLVEQHLAQARFYNLYIHPFELSLKQPILRRNIGLLQYTRYRTGLGSVGRKLRNLIKLLVDEGYEFTTYQQMWNQIVVDIG